MLGRTIVLDLRCFQAGLALARSPGKASQIHMREGYADPWRAHQEKQLKS
jgi:hypothetical protein